MLTVTTVYREGHENLNQEQLNYVRTMANRSGFSVLGGAEPGARSVVQIRLNVPMTDPVFKALVEDTPSPAPAERR